MPTSEPLLAYCHIFKTAGMTLRYLLRRHFGPRHLDIEHRMRRHSRAWFADHFVREEDLRFDLRVYPFARSVCGHFLRPCVDFGRLDNRLHWYTFLRSPSHRYVSHYLWSLHQPGAKQMEFGQWMDKTKVDNLQVRWLAGSEDLEAAKKILRERFRFVGLVERFDESLLLLRARFGLHDFDVRYAKARNSAAERGDDRRRRELKERLSDFQDEIDSRNQLDAELYAFASDELWPQQVADYGETRLAADRQLIGRSHERRPLAWLRYGTGLAYRNTIYKFCLRRDRQRARGEADTDPLSI